MKKSFILLFFVVNIAFGQNSVTILPSNTTAISTTTNATINLVNTNTSNNNDIIYSESQGLGKAGHFKISNSSSSATALQSRTNGSGYSFRASQQGTGTAGLFEIFDANNSSHVLHSYNFGTGRAGYFQIDNAANTNAAVYGETNGSGAGGYFTSTSGAALITGTGRVGIGLTPSAKFHVGGTESEKMRLENSTTLANGVSTEMYFKTGTYFTGAIKTIGASSAAARMGLFTFAEPSSSALVERLSISDGGNVGIGVTNPLTKLHVNGDIRSSNLAGTGVRKVSADANGTLVIAASSTSYYNIPSQSFRAEVSANSTTDISGRATLISGNSGWLEAPVQLPHGATVTSAKVYFLDNEASKGLDIKFFYTRMDGSLIGAIGQLNYIGSSATELLQTIPVSAGVATIDNQNNWYHIGMRVLNDGAGESTWTNNLAIRGILISYTMPN